MSSADERALKLGVDPHYVLWRKAAAWDKIAKIAHDMVYDEKGKCHQCRNAGGWFETTNPETPEETSEWIKCQLCKQGRR